MRTRSGALAVVLGLAWAAPAVADQVRGVIVRVDLQRNELQIEVRSPRNRGLALSFALDKDTKVLLGREAGVLADLAPGRRVQVIFDLQGGAQRALSVRVNTLRRVRGSGAVPAPAMPAKADPNTVAGVLRRVSYAEREVVVVGPGPRGGETETTVAVPKEARVTRDGKVIAFDDLKDGQRATIQTEKRGGKLVARSIQVGEAAAAVPAERGSGLARLRRLLQMADQILEQVEGMREDRPQPKEPPR